MIDSKYAVDCLRQGFERYIRYKKIDATIDIGSNYVSFYVKDFDNTGKQYMARTSTHHLKMQRIADKDKPWKGDNISIAFITPKSKQDSQVRATVRQNAQGTIQPFDITTYQYNNTILDESDLSDIFHSIVSFLNGQGYSDPFKGTAKQAKVISRHSNIKPYKVPATHTNISIDSNNNNRITTKNGYGADYVSESKDIYNNNDIKTENYMRNNKRTIRLTESDLHRIIKESVKRILDEHETGLDWRTLQNAAFKSYNRGYDEHFDDKEEFEKDMERTGRFTQAARDAFKQQHPSSRGHLVHGNGRRSGHTDAMGYPSPLATFYPGYDLRRHSFTGNVEKYLDSENGNGISFSLPPSRMTPAEREVVDFATGKTEYVPGKGWQ